MTEIPANAETQPAGLEIKKSHEAGQRETSLVGFLPEIDAVAHLVRTEIARLKQANEKTDSENDKIESRVKELVALARLLQTLCDLASDARRAEQEQNGGGRDIVEFRKQLERKIAALGETGQDQ